MSIFEVNNVKYAVGLTWHSANKEDVNAEIQQKIKSLASDKSKTGLWGVILAESDTEQQYATTDNKEHEKTISGACVLADYQATGELWFVDCVSGDPEKEDASFWFCSVEDGVITNDKIGDRHSIKQEIGQLAQYFADEEQVRELTVPVELEDEFAFDMNISVHENISFSDILSEIPKPEKTFSEYRLKSLKKMSPVALGCGVAAAVAVALLGYGFLTASEDVVVDNVQWDSPTIIPDKIENNREEEEKRILEMAYEEEVHWLRQDFMNHDSAKILSRIIEIDRMLPDYVGGWRVTNLGYSDTNSGVISVSLTREAYGTPVTLEKSIKGYKDMIFAKGGQTAILTINIGDIRRDEVVQDIIGYIVKESDTYGEKSIMHDAHFAGLGWRVEAAEETDRPFEIAGIADRKKAKERQLQMKKDVVALSNEGIDTLTRSGLILERANTLLINRINISRESKQSWRLEGTIYDK
ncbi:hypothetical protein [Vibrio owensii]|uniref:hypothetical protein n=1 Tax=Vibrio harveyi group TaxID=717610 RepID=UPI003CC5FD4A